MSIFFTVLFFKSYLDIISWHMIAFISLSKGDKLEGVSIQGMCGEELPLYMRIEAIASGTKWLQNLCEVLKNTMTIAMQACVQARIEEGT